MAIVRTGELPGLVKVMLGLFLLTISGPGFSMEPPTDGVYTLHSVTTLSSAGSLQPRSRLQYAVNSSTFDMDRPPLLADSGGLTGGEDTSEFSSTVSACTGTNLPNYDGDEPPCLPMEIGDTRPPLLPDEIVDGPVGTGQHVQATVSLGGLTWVPLFQPIPMGGDVLAYVSFIVSDIVGRELTWDDINLANSSISTLR